MTFEDELRAACAGTKGVTLWRAGDRWQANVLRPDGVAWSVAIEADPVEALRSAIDQKRHLKAAPPKPRSVFD